MVEGVGVFIAEIICLCGFMNSIVLGMYRVLFMSKFWKYLFKMADTNNGWAEGGH